MLAPVERSINWTVGSQEKLLARSVEKSAFMASKRKVSVAVKVHSEVRERSVRLTIVKPLAGRKV